MPTNPDAPVPNAPEARRKKIGFRFSIAIPQERMDEMCKNGDWGKFDKALAKALSIVSPLMMERNAKR